jgi:hypothetical protein
MDRLGDRFPAGERALKDALRRERVPLDGVELGLGYTGVSWSLHVEAPRLGYRRVAQLAPEDLRADTAWLELCDSIAEELGDLARRAPRQPG